jgi:mgtE-like transporter
MTYAANSRTFLATLKEALFAYSFDINGILAGFIVASQLNVFQRSPWAIAIYPAILSARGVISGLFSGRLGTALHIGTMRPKLFGNTKSFYKLFFAIIVVTLETSIAMSLFSAVFGSLLWGITFANFPDILMVVVATMTLGELTLSLFTVNVAFLTFKKGLDPDIIVYPVMSTVADITITLCYALTLNMFFLFGFIGKYTIVFLGVLLVALTLYILSQNIHEEEFVKTIKESFLTLLFVAFIVNITGTALNKVNVVVEGRREIYTVYPALIDTVGDVGSVVGSTATTKLALGLLKPSLSSMRTHFMQVFGAWGASIIIFTLLSMLSLLVQGMLGFSTFLELTTLLLITNLIAVAFIVFISYATSILTFVKGLDPDNFVIPIESSLADSITTIALFVALLLVG